MWSSTTFIIIAKIGIKCFTNLVDDSVGNTYYAARRNNRRNESILDENTKRRANKVVFTIFIRHFQNLAWKMVWFSTRVLTINWKVNRYNKEARKFYRYKYWKENFMESVWYYIFLFQNKKFMWSILKIVLHVNVYTTCECLFPFRAFFPVFCCISIPLENVRKPLVFRGYRNAAEYWEALNKWEHWNKMCVINEISG